MLYRCGLELTLQRLRGLRVFVTPSTEGLADPSRAAAVPVRGEERGRQRTACAGLQPGVRVSVSCCRCNRSSPTSWHKAARVHGPVVLPGRVGRPGWQGSGCTQGREAAVQVLPTACLSLGPSPFRVVLVIGRNSGPCVAAAKPLPPEWPPAPRPSSHGLQTSKVAPIPSQAPDSSEFPSCLWLGKALCF